VNLSALAREAEIAEAETILRALVLQHGPVIPVDAAALRLALNRRIDLRYALETGTLILSAKARGY
jgi:hypothetical protein